MFSSMQSFPCEDLVLAYEDALRSGAALTFAAELAGRLGATLHVVHVIDLNDYPIDPDLAESPQERQFVERAADRAYQEISDFLRKFSCAWTYSVETGNPVLRINQVAERHAASAIVAEASTPGLAGIFHRSLKGSVLKELVKSARRVIIVVPRHMRP
ncbi:universal stress protein [Streptomyces sp. NPDC047737]|uniref:universal stress protein n=2 Tax=unclassified Streptomyces TaxID=2593676 RepID=UPI0033F8CBD4